MGMKTNCWGKTKNTWVGEVTQPLFLSNFEQDQWPVPMPIRATHCQQRIVTRMEDSPSMRAGVKLTRQDVQDRAPANRHKTQRNDTADGHGATWEKTQCHGSFLSVSGVLFSPDALVSPPLSSVFKCLVRVASSRPLKQGRLCRTLISRSPGPAAYRKPLKPRSEEQGELPAAAGGKHHRSIHAFFIIWQMLVLRVPCKSCAVGEGKTKRGTHFYLNWKDEEKRRREETREQALESFS